MTRLRVERLNYSGKLPIDGYGPGFFRIDGKVHRGMVAVLPSGVIEWGGTSDTKSILSAVGSVDLLLVGTGGEVRPLPDSFRETLAESSIAVEAMPTPAACRTYNVLLGEGRRVAVALMPV